MSTRFLGLEFEPVRLDDRSVFLPLLRRFPQRITGYTFASLAAWAGPLGFLWTHMGDDCVLIARPHGPERRLHLLQPLGFMDGGCCDALDREARALPYALRLLSVSKDFLDAHPSVAARFTAVEDRAGANYVYRASDLAGLPGHDYAKKRNLVAQFESLYPTWSSRPLDAACGPACQDVLLSVAHAGGVPDDDASLRAELEAVEFAVRHNRELEQDGLVVLVDDKPVAFSIYERLDADTTVVHFEKALRAFKGLYQVVNREAARRIVASGATRINREDDVGDDGLRQAKLSYHPIEILPVYNLTMLPAGVPARESPEADAQPSAAPAAWEPSGAAMHRA